MFWRNKVVLVTGGSAGLGLAIARKLLEAGARVALAAREAQRVAAAAAELQSLGEVLGIPADMTRADDVERTVDAVRSRFGRLDGLVNNVGRSSRGLAAETTPEQFQEFWEVNFLSAVRCTRAALPLLQASGGHLVFIGSLASKSAARYLGPYAVTKFPLAAYAQQLRLELGPQGLHVLLVCPGPLQRAEVGDRYGAQAAGLPPSAHKAGAGVKLKGLVPAEVARRILLACETRQAELVLPWKARLLFAVAQLSPAWGDWLLSKTTGE